MPLPRASNAVPAHPNIFNLTLRIFRHPGGRNQPTTSRPDYFGVAFSQRHTWGFDSDGTVLMLALPTLGIDSLRAVERMTHEEAYHSMDDDMAGFKVLNFLWDRQDLQSVSGISRDLNFYQRLILTPNVANQA
ncbi:uncharacterized protein FPRN_02613 [Fusarium proliferatum]|nr:uncharacterized protein FPRN_02613 [Fusarium proliferatum]